MGYDSRPETRKHIMAVQGALLCLFEHLRVRLHSHDLSKLEEPEVSVFNEMTPKLKGSTYGSDEYKQFLVEMKPALDHHYASNRHHPEHHRQGIRGMNLVDLVEMFCDWYAATKRHADGDIMRSIQINQERFGYSDDLVFIFQQTALLLNENESDR